MGTGLEITADHHSEEEIFREFLVILPERKYSEESLLHSDDRQLLRAPWESITKTQD